MTQQRRARSEDRALRDVPPGSTTSKVRRGIDGASPLVTNVLDACEGFTLPPIEAEEDGAPITWFAAQPADGTGDGETGDPALWETPEERDEHIVARYHDGLDTTQLAAEFDVHRITILRALRRAGIETKKPVLDASRVHDVRTYYDAGHTIEETARHFGVSRGSIYRYMESHGIPRRRKAAESDAA